MRERSQFPSVSIVCATRGRPKQAMKMALSALKTASQEPEIIFGVDNDDPESVNYRGNIISGPDWGFAFKTQNLIGHATGDMIMIVGDDCRFETKGWDDEYRKIASLYDDGIFCICANDQLKKDGKIGYPHPCVGRRWYEILGYVYHPMFIHFSGDRWITDMAWKLSRMHYLPEVHIPHHRMTKDTKNYDDTYHRIRSTKQVSSRDEHVFGLTKRYMDTDLKLLRKQMR